METYQEIAEQPHEIVASFSQQPPIGIHPQDVFSPPPPMESMSRSFNFSSSFHAPEHERDLVELQILQKQHQKAKSSTILHESSQVYSAVYSGVSVYEMICRNVAVMRRQKDSYLNATQVLKVANIDKGKRTKILEKEILNKEHEKVQGGYGKYQGTWYHSTIPFERGLELAKQFRVDDVLSALFEFQPGSHPTRTGTEQPAPHVRAPATTRRTANNLASAAVPVNVQPVVVESAAKRIKIDSTQTIVESPENTPCELYLEGNAGFGQQPQFFDFHDPKVYHPHQMHMQQQQHHYQGYYNMDPYGIHHQFSNHHMLADPQIALAAENNGERHRAAIISLFVNSAQETSSQELFLSPHTLMAPDFDINLILDDQGHTALHWAAALGIVKLIPPLLQKGCRIDFLNFAGESALLRSVMVSSNYENQSFMDLLSILKDIICIPDKKNRTVLHHICLSASLKGGVNSCIYYMQCVLDFYAKSAHDEALSSEMVHSDNKNSLSSRFSSILNIVDICGDTAVNIAARIGNRHLFDLLVDAGADVTIPNYAFLKPSDYGFEALKANDSSQPTSVMTTVLYPSIKSDQENAVYSDNHLPAHPSSEKSQSEIIAELQSQLSAMSKEISQYRKSIEPLEIENAEIPLLKYRIQTLENTIKNMNSASSISEAGSPASSSKEELVNDEVLRLKEALVHQKAVEVHLCHEIKVLRATSSQHEIFCKRIISECCNVPLDNVVEVLQPLLDAVESNDSFNLAGLVASFMNGIRESAKFESL